MFYRLLEKRNLKSSTSGLSSGAVGMLYASKWQNIQTLFFMVTQSNVNKCNISKCICMYTYYFTILILKKKILTALSIQSTHRMKKEPTLQIVSDIIHE